MRFEGTWAKLANMVYLEAPAGVGFSYSDDKADYTTDDDKTVADNLEALQAFFKKFPNLKSTSLFLTGESYAGVYTPTLAEAVLAAADAGTYDGAPLAGIGVGNGCSGTEVGVCGGERWIYGTKYLMATALASPAAKANVTASCDFTAKAPSPACSAAIDALEGAVGHVDLYNIYGECVSGDESNGATLTQKVPYERSSRLGGPDACIDSRAGSAYFNQPAVMTAAHVRTPDFRWATCGNEIHYSSTRKNLPRDTYPKFFGRIRVVIYNGDWDACVPYTDAEAWTESLGLAVEKPWHPWLYRNGTQVAGYAINYANNFSFITVKGGRHEVPETAPEQALEMVRRLISGVEF